MKTKTIITELTQEDLEKHYFAEHPEGIAIKINPKAPRS